jgi:glutathione S-transferase
MPVSANADVEISAFSWLPAFAQGLARDLRVRWALEEAGLSYRERLFDARRPRPADYFEDQPFGQIPIYDDGEVRLFESGAIVLHIAEDVAELMPRDRQGRARTIGWVISALNSVEPAITELARIDLFNADAAWARARRPDAEQAVRDKLARVAAWLVDKDYLEDRFTAGDLIMTTVLRNLRHTTLVDEQPSLAAYKARCEARPAFQRALDAQFAAFNPPVEAEPA